MNCWLAVSLEVVRFHEVNCCRDCSGLGFSETMTALRLFQNNQGVEREEEDEMKMIKVTSCPLFPICVFSSAFVFFQPVRCLYISAFLSSFLAADQDMPSRAKEKSRWLFLSFGQDRCCATNDQALRLAVGSGEGSVGVRLSSTCRPGYEGSKRASRNTPG